VTYLAYPGTTGLETMDYRLTDPWLEGATPVCVPSPGIPGESRAGVQSSDSPQPSLGIPCEGEEEGFYSEKSVWLPRTFWCYVPSQHAAAVGPLPALASGRVTFGCLNLYSKVTAVMLANWAKILGRIPKSRLMVHSFRGSHRERARDIFAREGVERGRVEFVDRVLPAEYFGRYHEIDIALDTHPYPGGTTTCDALWMGVPVVTLAGRTALSRGSVSILSNVGMPELIARDEEQYVQKAVELATDLPRLAAIRASLRDRMIHSALRDAGAFARDVEAAYRRMWAQSREGR
jgi:predicted O-linked N-acetylglucosamine transferase (SPINDLY family)